MRQAGDAGGPIKGYGSGPSSLSVDLELSSFCLNKVPPSSAGSSRSLSARAPDRAMSIRALESIALACGVKQKKTLPVRLPQRNLEEERSTRNRRHNAG